MIAGPAETEPWRPSARCTCLYKVTDKWQEIGLIILLKEFLI